MSQKIDPMRASSGCSSGARHYQIVLSYFSAADDEGIHKQKVIFKEERKNWAFVINVFAEIAIRLLNDHDRKYHVMRKEPVVCIPISFVSLIPPSLSYFFLSTVPWMSPTYFFSCLSLSIFICMPLLF